MFVVLSCVIKDKAVRRRLHVPVFAQQFQAATFVRSAARAFGGGRHLEFGDHVINVFGAGFQGEGAGGATQTAVAGAVAAVVVEVDHFDVFELDVLPDVDLAPVQQRMDAD